MNDSSAKISVIVPVYKVEPYLRKCVDSIVNQTYTNLEIILIDDGSPDACGTICDEYAAKDERIKVIHKENGGVSSARNAGLDAATGDYIGFVDSDDWIEPQMYETLLLCVQKDNADLCICNCWDESENGNLIPDISPSPLKDELLSKNSVFYKLTECGGGVYAGIWNKLYRANLFCGIRFAERRRYEDEQIAIHVLDRCDAIATSTATLYHYIWHSDNFMCSGFSPARLDAVWALYDRYEYFKKHGYQYEARKSWQAAYGFLVTGLQKLPLKENWTAFAPLIKKVAFQSYIDLRTVKIMLIVIKKWLQETF